MRGAHLQIPAAGLVLLALAGLARAGERDGRWWWDADVGLGQSSRNNSVNGVTVADYGQQDFRASFGLNGYVVHPLIAKFRIDTQLALNDVENSKNDRDRYGLGANLNLLPKGVVPLNLSYRKSLYDFPSSYADVLARSSGTPESSTDWSARTELRRGFLRGLSLFAASQETDFLDPGSPKATVDFQLVKWSRQSGKGQHGIRLERRVNAYETVGLDTDDVTLRIDERRTLTPDWRWELAGDGIRRESFDAAQIGREVRDYRLRNRVRGTLRQDDSLEFSTDFGSTKLDSEPSGDARSARITYRMRAGRSWHVSPNVGLAHQSQSDTTIRSPQFGLGTFWSGTGLGVDAQLGATANLGKVRRTSASATEENRLRAYSLTASFVNGNPGTLRKTLELAWSTNEFRVERVRIGGLPDLGLAGAELGGSDQARARVNLFRAFDSRSFNAWAEWRYRSSSRETFSDKFESEGWTSSAQYTRHSFNFSGTVGRTTLTTAATAGQELQFASVVATWRPVRYVSIDTQYQKDRRNLGSLADIDASSFSARVRVRLGLLSFDASARESNQEMPLGGRRKNRTVEWSLSSRFAGWLPIVSGTKRRGTIR